MIGAPRALGRQGFLSSIAAQNTRENWGSLGDYKLLLEKLLANWFSSTPMTAAAFDVANLKYAHQMASLHQVAKHDGSHYNITSYGIALMVVLEVPRASSFTTQCGHLYKNLRNLYLKNPDFPTIPLAELREFADIDEHKLMKALGILEEISVAHVSHVVVDRKVYASPAIRNRADIWAVFEAMMPSYLQSGAHLDWSLSNNRATTLPQVGFENLLHPRIRDKALTLYVGSHYREAVLNSVMAIFDLMRERTGIVKDGAALVSEALALERPRMILSELDTESGRNDQKGFMQIIQGMYLGIRNPKAHSLDYDGDEHEAARYLIFASLIAQRITDAQIVD
jgi:uncharacterized protein (TIGR02391 family)